MAMKRRGPLIAIAMALPVVITLALTTRHARSDDPLATTCETDLRSVFERCERGHENGSCMFVPEHLGDVCQAGCVMHFCPDQAACTGRDPLWCAPCTDMHGARFWANLDTAQNRCDGKLEVWKNKVDDAVYHQCYVADVESRCPELAGRDWWAEFQAEMKK